MKKISILGIVLVLSILMVALTSCTGNRMAKKFGGTQTIELEAGKKLEVVTWKDDNLWLLTRDRVEGEKIEYYEFKESSSFGILEGTININEK